MLNEYSTVAQLKLPSLICDLDVFFPISVNMTNTKITQAKENKCVSVMWIIIAGENICWFVTKGDFHALSMESCPKKWVLDLSQGKHFMNKMQVVWRSRDN